MHIGLVDWTSFKLWLAHSLLILPTLSSFYAECMGGITSDRKMKDCARMEKNWMAGGQRG